MSKQPWTRRARSRVSEEGLDALVRVALNNPERLATSGVSYAMTGDCVVLVTQDEDGTRNVHLCAVEREFEIKAKR